MAHQQAVVSPQLLRYKVNYAQICLNPYIYYLKTCKRIDRQAEKVEYNVICDAKIRIFVESMHLFVIFFTNYEESSIKCR